MNLNEKTETFTVELFVISCKTFSNKTRSWFALKHGY